MATLIARAHVQRGRIFPEITQDLYGSLRLDPTLGPDERFATKLLELGKRNFKPWQSLDKDKSSTMEKLSYILFNHRMAMDAEVSGKFGRADFFWQQVLRFLGAVVNDENGWRELDLEIAEPEALVMRDPVQGPQLLVSELLIDTHCAFYNGYLQKDDGLSLDSRAFTHSTYIEELLNVVNFPEDTLRSLVAPFTEAQANLCASAGLWERASHLSLVLLKLFPDSEECQSRVASAKFESAIRLLSDGSGEESSRKNAELLKSCIAALERLQSDYPYNVTIYQLLGLATNLLAIQLANSNQLAEALIAIEKALLSYPSLEGALEARTKLYKLMEDIQSRAETLRGQLKYDPDIRLSETGRSMLREADRGFTPVMEYTKSEEAIRLSEASHAAQARQLWTIVGLEPPADRWDLRASILYETLTELAAEPPETLNELADRWQQATTDEPLLSEIDYARVFTFLRNRLFEGGEQEATDTSPTCLPPDDPPLLTLSATKVKRSGEPISYWLFSGQDKRLKALAAFAIVLVLFAGWLGIRQSSHRNTQDELYQTILKEKDSQRYLEVVENCERFLSYSSPGKDSRRVKVINYYKEALLSLVLQQAGDPTPEVIRHLENYRIRSGAKP